MIVQKFIFRFFILTLISCGTNTDNTTTVSYNPTVSADTLLNLSDSITQINYFKYLQESKFTSKEFWGTINVNKENYNFGIAFHDSKAFQYILSHRKDFEILHSPDSIQRIICRAFEFTLKEASKTSSKFELIKKEIYIHTGGEAKRIF